jgi:AcrR family transcriptional regulator
VNTMQSLSGKDNRKLGRPLSFDRDEALKQAMYLFWAHGYEATSIADLTAGMGITPPSLYAAFGDKKRLFLEAVKLYRGGAGFVASDQMIDGAPDAAEAARQMLEGSALHFTGPDTPPGCLLATGVISCSAAAADVQAALANIRIGIEARLRGKIAADMALGIIGEDVDADILAAYIMAIIQGMSTLARDGASRQKLQSLGAAVMRGWPS